VPVRVTDRAREDGRNPPLVDQLQRRFGVQAFPTLVVVAEQGEPIQRSGYAGKHETLSWLTRSAISVRMRSRLGRTPPGP
jgi:hypothetical protein